MVFTKCNIEHGHLAQKLILCRGTPRGLSQTPCSFLISPHALQAYGFTVNFTHMTQSLCLCPLPSP